MTRYKVVVLCRFAEPRTLKHTDCQRVAAEFARATQRALANQHGRLWSLARRVAIYDRDMAPGSYVLCPSDHVMIQGASS